MTKALKAKFYRTFDGREFLAGNGGYESGIAGYFVYVDRRGREYAQFEVYSLDVWGNRNDGFEVNDRSKCGLVWMPLDASDKEILRVLKQASLLNPRCHFKSFSISGDDLSIDIDSRKTSEPLLQAQVVQS